MPAAGRTSTKIVSAGGERLREIPYRAEVTKQLSQLHPAHLH